MKSNINELCNQLIEPNDLILPTDLEDLGITLCDEGICALKIFSKDPIPLSRLIPILNDFSFFVQNEVTFKLHDYYVTKVGLANHDEALLQNHKNNILEVLRQTLKGNLKSGKLFTLVYRENFCKRGILLMRSFVSYIDEIVEEFHETLLVDTLVANPLISRYFLDYFLTKFQPRLSDREQRMQLHRRQIDEAFKEVSNINDDRVLKYFYKLLQSFTRTTFFNDPQSDTFGHKIDLTNLKAHLRGIQPSIESFVYAPDLRGTHLRISKISRGGIRWSKRKKGFRQEIKSLMATQEAKNAIIIPNGAKGGFVILKDSINKAEFENYYTRFISTLLDLVDNQKEHTSYHPDGIICYDDFDSYFVVAADRGTASMSGVANRIAKKRNFWLGDAFASGSETGYHHKKLGITAKGAIKASQRHFIEKGIDFYTQTISVVGVGSMSGDVFGNGLIETPHFKLIGAISHNEIFIDPNPDIYVAYEERKRLFYTTSGSWHEYDPTKISQGGGVFKRSDNTIPLSAEIQALIGTDHDFMNGEELAQALLKLDVDLLYFGGIGTYVKSSSESNLTIGDKENEYVRIDANELNAYAICEGANLALTMQARIDYALMGGHINLDSIDNAAGVSTSDHEVNFKILLNLAKERGKIDENERIQLLHSATDFVVDRVLEENALQSLAISKDMQRSHNNIKDFKKTVRVLESELESFHRTLFLIPTERNFFEVVDDEGQIVRPILATLLLYSKIFIQNFLLSSELIQHETMQSYLFDYFPASYRDRFKEEILAHPLKDRIIATTFSNYLIDTYGSTLVKRYDELGEMKFIEKLAWYNSNKKENS